MENVLVTIADQLPAAVLVVVFMVFTLRWIDKRDTQRDERLAKHDFEIQSQMDERDQLMRQFWQGQQESNREVLDRLVVGVEKVITNLEAHDRKAEAAIANITASLPARAPARKPRAPHS